MRESLFCITSDAAPAYYAVGSQVIEAIPEDERHHESAIGNGVDVHAADSGSNGYSDMRGWRSFHHGEFLFSVSDEAAHKFFPGFIAEMDRLVQMGSPTK